MPEIGHKLNLGILGISRGNGHPYSWSSIINGYNETELKKCPYEIIIKYLRENKRKFPLAQVTHVWTQNYEESKLISSISKIPIILKDMNKMINNVDGVLLARDDFENHYKLSSSFLRKGMPVYIDKPLSNNIHDAKKIMELEKWEGQIFTCSALKYAKEIKLSVSEKNKIGKLKKIIGKTPNSWEKYSVHVIEPIIELISTKNSILKSSIKKELKKTHCSVEWQSGLITDFISTGKKNTKISIKFIGENNSLVKSFNNPYDCFREALEKFCLGIKKKKRMFNLRKLYRVLQIIELGSR